MGKYERVYQDLLEKIKDGTYPVGNLLPSEHQLTEHFSVSRETARKALAILTERGYIQKIMGKGSVVISHSPYTLPLHTLTSYKEIAAGTNATTDVLGIEHTTVPKHPFSDVQPDLQSEPAIKITRLRYLDGAPTIIDRDYIIEAVIPEIPLAAAQDSLYEYFENTLDLSIGYTNRQIRVEPATAQDRELLNLAKGEYVVVTASAVSLEDTRVFQYTESRHRADKFVYRTFARRA